VLAEANVTRGNLTLFDDPTGPRHFLFKMHIRDSHDVAVNLNERLSERLAEADPALSKAALEFTPMFIGAWINGSNPPDAA